jgi:hypothetical protein
LPIPLAPALRNGRQWPTGQIVDTDILSPLPQRIVGSYNGSASQHNSPEAEGFP